MTNRELINQAKDEVAREERYPNWTEMENWIIDNNMPVNVAIVMGSYWNAVCEKLIQKLKPLNT